MESRWQQTLRAEPCYLVTSHEAQVAQRLAALSDLRGSLVCDVLTPAGIHRLYGAAVLAYGNQSCGRGRETEEVGGDGGEKRGGRETRNGVSLTTFLMQMWWHHPPGERRGRNST